MKFSYIKAGIWQRPIIPITIFHGDKSIDTLALIDSGADFCVFHKDIADLLGIDLSKLKKFPFSGINPSPTDPQGSFVDVELTIQGRKTIKTAVVFSGDISNNGYAILGQQGFFNNYKVCFDYVRKEIELK